MDASLCACVVIILESEKINKYTAIQIIINIILTLITPIINIV